MNLQRVAASMQFVVGLPGAEKTLAPRDLEDLAGQRALPGIRRDPGREDPVEQEAACGRQAKAPLWPPHAAIATE